MSAFQVLAEPHRRHILDLLREGERSVNELVAGLGLSQPGVSKHLRVLRDAGLVGVRVDAQRRLYALQPQALAEVDRWLQPYRALWSERLDALGRHLTSPRRSPMTAERPTAERPTADGTVEKEPDGSTTIRFDRRLRHPIEPVWQALTDPDELRSWWGDTKLELVKGGPFQLRWRNTDEHGDVATLDGTITSIDPPRLLEISADWGTAATGQPGTRTHLTWELEPDGDHTLLHFTNKVEAPAREVTTAAGWHLHLDALATVLSGGEVDIAHPEDLFAPIHQAYTDRYGPGPEPGDNATPRASEADSSS